MPSLILKPLIAWGLLLYPKYTIQVYRETVPIVVYGNVMSMLDEEHFPTATTIPSGGSLVSLFDGNTNLIDASNLVLPATTLKMTATGVCSTGVPA